MTAPVTHREVERKFRVHALFVLPDFSGAAPGVTTRAVEPFDMAAVYHDTDELTLFRWGITLRRREGGPDEGWHMKLPVAGADGSTRDEMHVPLTDGAIGSVPGSLVSVVAPLLHELPLKPVISLATVRTPVVLRGASGRDLLEIVDDTVTVRHGGQVVSVFREVEVELLSREDHGADELMDQVCSLLLTTGAEPSSVSKAASALGPGTAQPPDVPQHPFPSRDGLAVDAIKAVLSQHVRHLLMADVSVRRDLPDSVHQMRVAARRLRSALSTFAPLMDASACQELKDELRWMASELGAIRDTEVLMERLDTHADALVDSSDAQRCRDIIDPLLRTRMAAARSSALAALRSDRHQQLVDDLMDLAVNPPVTDAAFVPCGEVLPGLVARAWKRLRASVTGLEMDGPSAPWHEARIKAKRVRYAAEAVEDILGRPMHRLADCLAEVTEVLGDHQDAHVAQTLLREIAAMSETDGMTGMALGLLHEVESAVELTDRRHFREIWPKARQRAKVAGIA